MKKTTYSLFAFLIFALSCTQSPKEMTLEEKIAEYKKSEIDLLNGATPKDFSAKTIDGTTFSSKEYRGKYWVIFVYDKSYLTKSESYDMLTELNNTHKLFGDKIPMIGIINGFCDNEPELKKQMLNTKLNFKQIDNTKSPSKERKVKDNVFCTPAKIIIDQNGKVIYNGCGGKTNEFDYKLESLIKEKKL